jgi:peptidoglycan/xylan/chitin deacetylase (PgdA/CDA1 family)
MRQPAAVFLMYHEIALPQRKHCQSEPGYVRYVISADEFETQMSVIQKLGLRGLSVGQALQFSSPAVAITVDDGCETDLLAVAPVLKRFDFNATFYITAGFLGGAGYMSRNQLQELSGLGFEIGSHSMTHPYLSDLNESGLRREIVDSKLLLEDIIGRPVDHFSCPGGRYDSRTIIAVRNAGYRTLANSDPRANFRSTDFMDLGRVAITRGLTKANFEKLCLGETLWKIGLSMRLRDTAKRLLGNTSYDRVRAVLLKK